MTGKDILVKSPNLGIFVCPNPTMIDWCTNYLDMPISHVAYYNLIYNLVMAGF